MTRMTYEYISTMTRDNNVLFMNYGFADIGPDAKPLALAQEDQCYQFEIQLYHRIAGAVLWDGLDALEVSSGRGGGASYLKRQFRPRSLVGVDFSARAVEFCKKYHSQAGLSFVQGNAEYLDFPDNAFNIIINVEASFYYPNFRRFLSNVARILRPGGHFLYADMRYQEELETWQTQLRETGLTVLEEEDITSNVLKALELDRERRMQLVQRYAPRLLRKLFAEFAGLSGAGMASDKPGTGRRVYKRYVLRKGWHS